MIGTIKVENNREKTVLAEFKKLVEELEQDDVTLIRFLKARDFNLEKAEAMLRQCIQWRKENSMDTILKWEYPNYLPTDLSYQISGKDYHGAPIVWVPFGKWRHRSWVEQGYSDELLRWGFRLIEDGLHNLKCSEDGTLQCTAIFDLAEISYYQAAHMASLKLLYLAFKALEQNYPEVLKCVVVVNAPWFFTIPFNFIKGVISPNTLSKLKVFDSNKSAWLNFLLERCPQKSLPKEYFEDENAN